MGRFGRSLLFCHLEYDKEANYDGLEIKMTGIDRGFWIKSGPCFFPLFN